MNEWLFSAIQKYTGADTISDQSQIQELWSGYGRILKLSLEGSSVNSVVAKHIRIPDRTNHPRGWNTDMGHQRKLHSYEVETNWYRNYSSKSKARVPECLGIEKQGEEVLILLEDLDEAGYPLRKTSLSWKEITVCLHWLAEFHAGFFGVKPEGLWEIGTYWHLETRPDELKELTDPKLKEAAPLIDMKLNQARFQTLVHGDAKLANFCFSEDGDVAAVDFQYVGGGCGMKDVAYFIGSCLNEEECERLEDQILDTYFSFLQQELDEPSKELETEWRSLYRVAWADFHRFLKGWSPGHWKINSYSERITKEVLESL